MAERLQCARMNVLTRRHLTHLYRAALRERADNIRPYRARSANMLLLK